MSSFVLPALGIAALTAVAALFLFRKWFVTTLKKKAEDGDAAAQYSLADMYAEGNGVRKDPAAAETYFRLAAEQGLAEAQGMLGSMYSCGAGVAQSDVEAVKWLRLAADQGDPVAMFNLGACWWNGAGVESDRVEAVKWHSIAAAQGLEIAQQTKEEVVERMTEAEVGEAERRAEEWIKAHPVEAPSTAAGKPGPAWWIFEAMSTVVYFFWTTGSEFAIAPSPTRRFRPLTYTAYLGGGLAAGLLAPGWMAAALTSYSIGVVLNIAVTLMMVLPLKDDSLDFAPLLGGTLLLGFFDSLKILVITAIVKWLTG